ncbi:MAG: xylulokinase [Bryobacteraceae bacterium]|nr:xylulokinase [Bryobacterales bacterium]MEB2361915.1 xylulokinase [Bryobacterales bacterium]NUN01954.1 xylulokinase [Bryobacteraceae bacterium]
MYWLGIDIGTGGSRAILADDKGRVKAGFTSPHEDMRMERPLWAEQRPENWWDAAQNAIRAVLKEAKVKPGDIGAVGLSGQMHGLVILDEKDVVIRPAIIWCDQRSQPQVDAINQKVGKDNVLAFTANPVLTGFTLPKLLWVRDCEPKNFARVRKLLLPKDYIRFKLTGEYATEVSDASGTALFDVVTRRWSEDMADRLNLDRGILPQVFESSEITGQITAEAAEATGLKAGTPVVGGGGDQAASAVGNGIVAPGIASCTLGTSGVVFAHMEKPNYDPQGRVHTFCHAVKGKWHVMGVTQGAGLSLQWFRRQLAPGAEYDALMAEAASAPASAHGLFWLPYLMGERTPHLDATARGGWIGLTARHTRADLIRAIIEGVSFSLKDCLDTIEGMGLPVDSVRSSGGGARSPIWRQILADTFGKKVTTLETQEGSAYGAAILAAVGAGAYTSVPEACGAVIREVDSIAPRPHESQLYQRSHEVYRSLYPTLRPIYSLIRNLG